MSITSLTRVSNINCEMRTRKDVKQHANAYDGRVMKHYEKENVHWKRMPIRGMRSQSLFAFFAAVTALSSSPSLLIYATSKQRTN